MMNARALEQGPSPAGSVFGPGLLMLKLAGGTGAPRHLRLVHALDVAQRLREAILSRSDGLPAPIQALLSGHDAAGSPLLHPHLAILPLASVGRPGADGRLNGLAVAVPRTTSEDDQRLALQTVRKIRRLVLGRLGVWNVAPGWVEKPEAWTAWPAGSSHWSTVTPIAYDAHPKAPGELAAMIARACAHVGLPEPREVIATQVSAHAGTPPAHAFPRLRRKDGHERRHSHFIVTFDRPVVGPLLLGAGRYRGYGLLRPLRGGEEDGK
jgi:CRISPR-associated protein Csb2